ncbi:MAG: reactive intermediate/imine deaminase [Cycloclasticus sp. symbiont of Bathymodiolus heckerae]|nr:MAG: reactive intermediate/imine deaminase [Cycloclasticus sp. symbiont of Bathymodiolus heckerae]
MKKTVVHSNAAPEAIGTYSQAIKVGQTVYLSGQIPLVPETMVLIDGGISEEIEQVLKNLTSVAQAAEGSLADIVKLNIFLTDMNDFPIVNEKMVLYFSEPYPARAAIGVAALPKGSRVEMDAIMVLSDD